jgi:hypothetical protein
MIILVVFAALAFACLAPLVHLAENNGRWSIVIIGGVVVVPLVWALAAFPLVRKGLFKDWLIRALLMVAVSVAFALHVFFAVMSTRGVFLRLSQEERFEYITLAGIILAVIVLGFALIFLLRRVVPGRCPECRRPTLLPDARTGPGQRAEPWRLYQCFLCGRQYSRSHNSWEAVRLPSDTR